MPDGLGLALSLALLGLLIGSFLNVVISRVPEGRSVVSPPSACPACGTPLSWRDNIPLLSWCILRGRCRTCSAPISIQYPLVEAMNALLWLTLTLWASADSSRISLLPLLLVLSSAGLALAAIDIAHHRLPDSIVLPLYPIAILGLLLNQIVTGSGHWLSGLLGALSWLTIIGGLWLITAGRGMGLGDVKLAPVLGAVLGWVAIADAVIGMFAAFVFGAVLGLALLLSGRAKRASRLAFGPFLLGGALLGLFLGEAMWNAYVNAMGL